MQKLFQEQRMYALVTLMSEVVETVPIKWAHEVFLLFCLFCLGLEARLG